MNSNAEHGFGHCVKADLRRFCALTRDKQASQDLQWKDWLRILSPRFIPMLLHRIAFALGDMGLGPVAKLVSLVNFVFFGIEIAVRCPIGGGLFFPHTQGTVIGALRVGANATIYQGVTLGAKDLDFSYSELARPVLGQNVVIGSGAKVLGGISIGDNVRIGANTVVTKPLAEGATAVGAEFRLLPEQTKR